MLPLKLLVAYAVLIGFLLGVLVMLLRQLVLLLPRSLTDELQMSEQPTTWPADAVVSLGLGVARAILGEEPKKDPRPWVRGRENELVAFDQAVTQASCRKRAAESWDE